MNNKYEYMAVTTDEFETPIAYGPSASELACKLDIDVNTVYTSIFHNRSGKIKGRKIIRIELL